MSKWSKFYERNEEQINELNHFIKKNRENIHLIIVSSEMYQWLKLFPKSTLVGSDILKYDGINVKNVGILVTNGINFLFKDSYIKYEIPCICGKYSDENHNHL
jgi:hypothetical protein